MQIIYIWENSSKHVVELQILDMLFCGFGRENSNTKFTSCNKFQVVYKHKWITCLIRKATKIQSSIISSSQNVGVYHPPMGLTLENTTPVPGKNWVKSPPILVEWTLDPNNKNIKLPGIDLWCDPNKKLGGKITCFAKKLGTFRSEKTQKHVYTLPETNIATENGWLEYYFPFGKAYFHGLC